MPKPCESCVSCSTQQPTLQASSAQVSCTVSSVPLSLELVCPSTAVRLPHASRPKDWCLSDMSRAVPSCRTGTHLAMPAGSALSLRPHPLIPSYIAYCTPPVHPLDLRVLPSGPPMHLSPLHPCPKLTHPRINDLTRCNHVFPLSSNSTSSTTTMKFSAALVLVPLVAASDIIVARQGQCLPVFARVIATSRLRLRAAHSPCSTAPTLRSRR